MINFYKSLVEGKHDFSVLHKYLNIMGAKYLNDLVICGKEKELSSTKLIASYEESFKTVVTSIKVEKVVDKKGNEKERKTNIYIKDSPIILIKLFKETKKAAEKTETEKKKVKKVKEPSEIFEQEGKKYVKEKKQPTNIFKVGIEITHVYSYFLIKYCMDFNESLTNEKEKSEFIKVVDEISSSFNYVEVEDKKLTIKDDNSKLNKEFNVCQPKLFSETKSCIELIFKFDSAKSSEISRTLIGLFAKISLDIFIGRLFSEKSTLFNAPNFFTKFCSLSGEKKKMISLLSFIDYKEFYKTSVIPNKKVKAKKGEVVEKTKIEVKETIIKPNIEISFEEENSSQKYEIEFEEENDE